MNKIYNGLSGIREVVSPGRFIEITKRNPGSIKSSEFIPPKIGRRNDFGSVVVNYKYGSKR